MKTYSASAILGFVLTSTRASDSSSHQSGSKCSREKLNKGGMRAGFEVDYLEGDNDWPAVMKALDEIGYHGWAIAEPAYHPPGAEPAERLKQISTKMDKILAM